MPRLRQRNRLDARQGRFRALIRSVPLRGVSTVCRTSGFVQARWPPPVILVGVAGAAHAGRLAVHVTAGPRTAALTGVHGVSAVGPIVAHAPRLGVEWCPSSVPPAIMLHGGGGQAWVVTRRGVTLWTSGGLLVPVRPLTGVDTRGEAGRVAAAASGLAAATVIEVGNQSQAVTLTGGGSLAWQLRSRVGVIWPPTGGG